MLFAAFLVLPCRRRRWWSRGWRRAITRRAAWGRRDRGSRAPMRARTASTPARRAYWEWLVARCGSTSGARSLRPSGHRPIPERAANTGILALSGAVLRRSSACRWAPDGSTAAARSPVPCARVGLLLSMPPLLTSLFLVFSRHAPDGSRLAACDRSTRDGGERRWICCDTGGPVLALAMRSPRCSSVGRPSDLRGRDQPYVLATLAARSAGARHLARRAEAALRPIASVYGSSSARSSADRSPSNHHLVARLGGLMLDALRARDVYSSRMRRGRIGLFAAARAVGRGAAVVDPRSTE